MSRDRRSNARLCVHYLVVRQGCRTRTECLAHCQWKRKDRGLSEHYDAEVISHGCMQLRVDVQSALQRTRSLRGLCAQQEHNRPGELFGRITHAIGRHSFRSCSKTSCGSRCCLYPGVVEPIFDRLSGIFVRRPPFYRRMRKLAPEQQWTRFQGRVIHVNAIKYTLTVQKDAVVGRERLVRLCRDSVQVVWAFNVTSL